MWYTARVRGYHRRVWFSMDAITNIVALKHVIEMFHVEYDCNGSVYTVMMYGMPNIEFRMTEDGLHVYFPGKNFTFVNTVSGNKEGYSKRQLSY